MLDGALVQPLIKYITDCDGAGDAPDCGGTPARWPVASVPARICTAQQARPSGVSVEDFRDLVARAAETWNSQEIAAGVDYIGDCVGREFWVFNNLQNEIGWDDRQVLSSTQAAVTRSSIPLVGGVRVIRESDIVLDPDLGRLSRVCLESTIVHEFGHYLGLGHSDDRLDLMYPSFDPNNLATCKLSPTAGERARLQALYGIDRAPTVTLGGRPVEPNTAVPVAVTASDPEGGPLTYRWRQVSGPSVTVISEGAAAKFVAPGQLNDTVALRVTVRDRFGHPATATANFVVSESVAPPANAPGLESFLPGGGGDAVLGWSVTPDAAVYELCGRPSDFPAEFECAQVGGPQIGVSWDTVLGTAGRSDDYRLITTGARETFLRGCNSKGCSIPGTGGLSGGLRWATWNIDYDYFALAYDVGTIQFTIVGVVNVSGTPRTFTLATGPAAEPAQQRMTICGMLRAGQVCFGYLGPGARHAEYVDILAEAPDRPTIEHRIRVR